MRIAILLIALFAMSPAWAETPPAPKGIVGIWQGTLKAGGAELRLAFHVSEKDGKYSATMDSIDQGVKNIPVATTEFADNKLTLKIPVAKITFTGTLQADGKTIKGEFEQGMKFPMDLQRVDKVAEVKRPQHPKGPFPYHVEEVTFPSTAKDVKLAGTFTKPNGDGPFPAVILISGSGPQNRDEELMGHKPFLVLADHLTRKGVAVLRYDDRGAYKSTGDHATATTKDFADDAQGAVAWLKGRKEINKIGLMGHSEGGLIAPIVAASNPNVNFIILLAGPGLPGDVILAAQRELILKAGGANDELLKKVRVMFDKVIGAIKEGADKDKLLAITKEMNKQFTPEDLKTLGVEGTDKSNEQAIEQLLTPWMKYFLAFDPRPTLKKVQCPVFALNGELDLQVPCQANLDAIAAALKAGGNKDVTTKAFPKLNHLFQTSTTGHPKEYAQIEETFAPVALDAITQWILERK